MSGTNRLGRNAEDEAADYLLGVGYTLITRRWRCSGGEIDIIALDGDLLVFVEVRARRGRSEPAEYSISSAKLRRFTLAAERYLETVGVHDKKVRFDIIAIDENGLRHHQDIYQA